MKNILKTIYLFLDFVKYIRDDNGSPVLCNRFPQTRKSRAKSLELDSVQYEDDHMALAQTFEQTGTRKQHQCIKYVRLVWLCNNDIANLKI